MGQEHAKPANGDSRHGHESVPMDWERWRSELRAFCAETRRELATIVRSLAADAAPARHEPLAAAITEQADAGPVGCTAETGDRLEQLKRRLNQRIQDCRVALPAAGSDASVP